MDLEMLSDYSRFEFVFVKLQVWFNLIYNIDIAKTVANEFVISITSRLGTYDRYYDVNI